MKLTEEIAQAAITAARMAASVIGVPMNIAVLDDGAHLKAFSRMDGALLGSIDIALGKAKTSALFGMTSEAVGEFCKPGGPSPGLELTNGTLAEARVRGLEPSREISLVRAAGRVSTRVADAFVEFARDRL